MLRALSLFFGVLALSTSVIWIKASHAHPIVLAALRLALASLLLLPLELRERRRHAAALRELPGFTRQTWIAGAFLAVHFIAWIIGARLTASAQASLIVNLAPLGAPFFLHFFAQEQINRREIIGTIIVVSGLLILTAHDALTASGSVAGNLTCFVAMLLFAAYLALARRNRGVPSVWLYVVPVYRHAAIIALVIALPWLADGVQWSSAHEWFALLGLTIVPTMIGHSLINRAMRHFRGQVVSLANCAQFVFAGITAYVVFAEIPSPAFFFAAAIVATGIVIVIRSLPTGEG